MKTLVQTFLKILLLSAIVISCKNSNTKVYSQLLTFDLKELPEQTTLKLSDLGATDIQYIPLETNDQSLIPGNYDLNVAWNRLIVGNGFFIIKHSNTILKFRNDGSFITHIGTLGKGPNEFTVAHDVDIDNENQNLYLASGWQEKFNVYSESGKFIRTFKIPLLAPIQFRINEDGILCYIENNLGNIENSFVLMDADGAIIKNFPNRYPFNINKGGVTSIGRENLFYRFNNQLFKKEIYSDTVYVYENMDFKPHLVIEVGNRLLTPKARSEFDLFYLSKNYIRPLNLFEFGDYIYYEFTYEIIAGKNTLVNGFIGSKKTGFQTIINAEKGLINDIDGGLNMMPKTIKDDNTIISWVDAFQLKSHVASEAFKNSTPKFPQKKRELESLANNLKETDNPVLIMVKLKK